MLHNKFQTPEPSRSGEEDFMSFSFLKPRTPRCIALFGPQGRLLMDGRLATLRPFQQYFSHIRAMGG